jgi:hypothetical protein
MDGDQIDNDIKRSFIEELDGGLVIVSANKFDFITPEEFINKFDFVGITQGNRPQFSPKGTEITEEEELEYE